MTFARFALHVVLCAAFALAAFCFVLPARLRFAGPLLVCLAAHERHLRRAIALARGEG